MRILAGLFAVAAWLIPASARAVTPDELVRLRDAGLGDEVLAIPPAPDRPASHTRR